MAKSTEKLKAISLRREGWSIKKIAKEVEASVASVSNWCRDVELSTSQIEMLSKYSRDPYYGRRKERILQQRKERLDITKKLFDEGIEEIGSLTKRELLLIGIALYWAEGYKKDNQAGLGSSDPRMMKMFVKWLVECFDYSVDDLLFRVTVNSEHEYRISEIIKYWADLFGIETSRFQKPFYQKTKWKKSYENPNNYYGVLRVRPRRSANLLRKILGMIEGLKEQV